MRRFDPTLYLVTGSTPTASLLTRVEQAVLGGVTLVQLRHKQADLRALIEQARCLLTLLRPLGIPLLINDSVEAALRAEADGVHLGQQDAHPLSARKILGRRALIGLSLETLSDAVNFSRAGWNHAVDYVAVSPLFSTSSKHDAKPPLGLAGLRKIKDLVGHPVIAIGGINEANVARVIQHGADGVAVISAIFNSATPEKSVRKLLQKIKQGRGS